MVLQSSSGPEPTLSELLEQLGGLSVSEDVQRQHQVQRIRTAAALLAGPPSRDRLQHVRHQCSCWSIPLRDTGSVARRPLKDLCDELSDGLRRAPSDVLCSREGSAPGCVAMPVSSGSEHASLPAGSTSEHLSRETKSDHADGEKPVSMKARRQEQGAAPASVGYGSVVEVDGLRGVVRPLDLEPAAAAVSMIALKHVGEKFF